MPDVGAPAPAFALTNQHGQTVEPVGRGPVLLVFFPFAFSGVCTGELQGLRDRRDDLGVDVVGLSCDPMFALRTFADAERLGFDLLSDFWPHGEVARAYGCFDEQRGAASRSSFLLDAHGAVHWSLHHAIGDPRPVEAHLAATRAIFS